MKEKKNILFLSTKDKDGAGLSYLKVVEMLRSKGVDATMVVCNKYSDSDACIGVFDAHSRWGRIRIALNHCYCKMRKILAFGKPVKKYIMFDLQIEMVSAKKILTLYGKTPDVIRVGWVPDFISAKTIKELQELTGATINYSMVDNAPIGGGCHYPWDCQGYTRDCFPCPALKPTNKRAQKTLRFKHRYITPDMIISGTTNDINRARKSLLFRDSKCVVTFSLRPNPYYFTKKESRAFFGIEEERYVMFCGADSIRAERKGFKELIESLELVKHRTDVSNVTIIVAGGECGDFPSGYDIIKVGKLSFEDLFRAYACADVFLCPSLEDSGPIMIKYGVMAYIPVVAFEMGVALDVIHHRENGYLAKWRDVSDYAEGILYCMVNQDKFGSNLKQFNDHIMEKSKEKSVWKSLGIELR